MRRSESGNNGSSSLSDGTGSGMQVSGPQPERSLIQQTRTDPLAFQLLNMIHSLPSLPITRPAFLFQRIAAIPNSTFNRFPHPVSDTAPLYQPLIDASQNEPLIDVPQHQPFIIESLPVPIKENSMSNKLQKKRSKGKTCAICLASIRKNTRISEIPCGHDFHNKCLFKWLRTTPSCPLCRQQVFHGEPQRRTRVRSHHPHHHRYA